MAETKRCSTVLTRCRKYGITVDEYDQRLKSQGGVCAACLGELLPWPCLDHCHETGKVRGILCNACNLSLGFANDSSTRLRQLIDYLESV